MGLWTFRVNISGQLWVCELFGSSFWVNLGRFSWVCFSFVCMVFVLIFVLISLMICLWATLFSFGYSFGYLFPYPFGHWEFVLALLLFSYMVESGEREQRGKWNIANSMIGFLVVPSIFVWVSVEYGIHFAWLGCVVWLLVRALVRTFSCCNIVPCSSLTPCLCHQYLVWLPSSFSLLSCQPCGRWCMQLVFWFPVQFVHCTVGNPISEISGVHPVVGWFLWSLLL